MLKCEIQEFGMISTDMSRRRRPLAVLLAICLIGFVMSWPRSIHAMGLECPETGPGVTPNPIALDSQIRRMTTANDVDLANEIDLLITRLKDQNSTISSDTITNTLIAAYCRAVAEMPNTSAEKWQLMRQFDRVLRQQIAAETMPQGTLIIANIPLPSAIYQRLTSQAQVVGQKTVDFMAAILISAAGQ